VRITGYTCASLASSGGSSLAVYASTPCGSANVANCSGYLFPLAFSGSTASPELVAATVAVAARVAGYSSKTPGAYVFRSLTALYDPENDDNDVNCLDTCC